MKQEKYIQIRDSDFGLVQRKYKLSRTEISMINNPMCMDLIKRNIIAEIGQFLLDQGLISIEQEGDTLIANLYVVKNPKGGDK